MHGVHWIINLNLHSGAGFDNSEPQDDYRLTPEIVLAVRYHLNWREFLQATICFTLNDNKIVESIPGWIKFSPQVQLQLA